MSGQMIRQLLEGIDPNDPVAARAIIATLQAHLPSTQSEDNLSEVHQQLSALLKLQQIRAVVFDPMTRPEGPIPQMKKILSSDLPPPEQLLKIANLAEDTPPTLDLLLFKYPLIHTDTTQKTQQIAQIINPEPPRPLFDA